MVKGVANAETGVKIDTVTTTGSDEKVFSFDEDGGRDGFAHGFDPSVTIALTGEVAGSTGIMAAKFGVAQTIANVDDGKYADSAASYFGVAATGGWYLDGSPSITSTRGGFKAFSFEFLSCPSIT